jgi:hypothetical protein
MIHCCYGCCRRRCCCGCSGCGCLLLAFNPSTKRMSRGFCFETGIDFAVSKCEECVGCMQSVPASRWSGEDFPAGQHGFLWCEGLGGILWCFSANQHVSKLYTGIHGSSIFLFWSVLWKEISVKSLDHPGPDLQMNPHPGSPYKVLLTYRNVRLGWYQWMTGLIRPSQFVQKCVCYDDVVWQDII